MIKWEFLEGIVDKNKLVELARKYIEIDGYENIVKAFCMSILDGKKVYHKDLTVRDEGDF